jgi:peptidyl-tRNA hydrolase
MVVVSKGKFCLSIGHQNYKSPKKKVQRPQFEKVYVGIWYKQENIADFVFNKLLLEYIKL